MTKLMVHHVTELKKITQNTPLILWKILRSLHKERLNVEVN